VIIVVHRNLISWADLIEIMKMKRRIKELVITGKYSDEKVIKRAGFVTEIMEIKYLAKERVKTGIGIEK
jgi:ATP:corrinoid adenosyltransferase